MSDKRDAYRRMGVIFPEDRGTKLEKAHRAIRRRGPTATCCLCAGSGSVFNIVYDRQVACTFCGGTGRRLVQRGGVVFP